MMLSEDGDLVDLTEKVLMPLHEENTVAVRVTHLAVNQYQVFVAAQLAHKEKYGKMFVEKTLEKTKPALITWQLNGKQDAQVIATDGLFVKDMLLNPKQLVVLTTNGCLYGHNVGPMNPS